MGKEAIERDQENVYLQGLGEGSEIAMLRRKNRVLRSSDNIDEAIRQYMDQSTDFMVPIVKVESQIYLVGDKKIRVEQRGDNLYVRVGGGYNKLQEFLDAYWKTEMLHKQTHGRSMSRLRQG